MPLFLFAFFAARGELASPDWSDEPLRLLALAGIALLTGFSVIAALLPPGPTKPAAI